MFEAIKTQCEAKGYMVASYGASEKELPVGAHRLIFLPAARRATPPQSQEILHPLHHIV
jgi:hypothetical protein